MQFSFADNQQVDSIDSVPENFRVFYRETGDGVHQLDSDNPVVKSAVASITGLANSLRAARGDADSARKSRVDLSSLSEYGDTPESIAETFASKMEELRSQLKSGESAKVDVEKVRAELSKGFQKQLGEKDAALEGLRGQLFSQLVDSEATRAIAGEKGVAELLMPFVRDQVKAVEEDGKFRVFVVDREGNRRYSGTTGEAMTISELVSEMKQNERYGRLFESEAPRGTGTSASPARRAAQPRAEMSSVDKIAAGLEAGRYQRSGRG